MKSITREKIIKAPLELVWNILSDTAELNRKLKLSPMSFATINGVRHGEQKVMGLQFKWTEAPWEWKYGSWIKNERVYSKGLFKSITGFFEVLPMGAQTKVKLTFTAIHRYPILAGLMNFGTSKVIDDLFSEIEKSAGQNLASPSSDIRFQSFEEWLAEAQGMERARIAPKLVARETGKNWEDILSEALSGKLKNRMSLRFDAMCPHCRGAKQSALCLTELPSKVNCETCEISFPVGTQESIEISLRDLALPEDQTAVDFCSGDVTHRPTILYQRLLGEWSDELSLPEGLYLFKRKGELRPVTIMTSKESSMHEIFLDDLWARDSSALRYNTKVKLISHAVDTQDLLMIESIDKFRGALTASEVMLHPELSKQIPEGVLQSDFAMEMGSRVLMFTDVVGSTDLYHKVGDSEAFRLVRESFVFVGDVARKYQGVLVKTIGDATMYTFPSFLLAMKCADELQEKNKTNPLKLRASLHYGPCLSVGTKTGVDFFGDTVNICAKFQSEVEAGQIVFDEELMAQLDDGLREKFKSSSEKVSFRLKGNSGREFLLRRVSR